MSNDVSKYEFAARLRTARLQSGLTQKALAESAGVPQSTIGRLETALHFPARQTIEKLESALGRRLITREP